MSDNVLNSIIESFYDTELKERMEEPGADEPDEYQIAVAKAYKDTQRILHGIGEYEPEKKGAIKDIMEGLKKYLENSSPVEKFEDVHENLCDLWIKHFKKDFTEYGIAQKIVNMSFKYLYAIFYVKNNHDPRLSKFNDCHFTLDSYTLRWLNGYKQDGKPECLNSKTSWSKLGKTEYRDIQDYAKKCVGDFLPKEYNCIKAEFLIWECVKLYDVLGVWAYVEKMDNNGLVENAKELFKEIDNICLSDFMDRIKYKLENMG